MRTSVLLMMVRWSRNGSSDLRLLGARSKSRPVSAGAHRFFLMPNARAAGRAVHHLDGHQPHASARPRAAWPLAMTAGVIASSSGNARVTPRPFSIVRREGALRVRNIGDLLGPRSRRLRSCRPCQLLSCRCPLPLYLLRRRARVAAASAPASLIRNAGLRDDAEDERREAGCPSRAASLTIAAHRRHVVVFERAGRARRSSGSR